jgi:hypothetical protein
VIADLVWGWTLMAVPVAIASGIALGEVTWRLGLFRDVRRMVWTLSIIGLLWYVPVNVRIAVDPDSTINVVRNIGGSLLWFLPYAGTAVLWRRWRER